MIQNYNFYDVIECLVEKGITTQIRIDDSFRIYADLNTGAKSHLHLYKDGTVIGRYGYTNNVFQYGVVIQEVIRFLALEFVNCLHGRSYYSLEWAKLYEDVIGGFDKIKEELYA